MTPSELKTEMEKLLVARVEIQTFQKPELGQWARNIRAWADDPETGHSGADELMVAVLRDPGYGEAMDIYEAQKRWYA